MVSLLNGLSAAGAGIAQFAGAAGLEQQRNNLAQQSAILADQLATTRETALEGQRQTFATGLQAQLQAFQGTQTDKEIAAREAAALQSQGAATTLEKMRENAPTETEKLFRFLKINPDGTPIAAAPTPAGTSVASSDTGGSAPTVQRLLRLLLIQRQTRLWQRLSGCRSLGRRIPYEGASLLT